MDIASNMANIIDVHSNALRASGTHLPNGRFTTFFGGNGAVGPTRDTHTSSEYL